MSSPWSDSFFGAGLTPQELPCPADQAEQPAAPAPVPEQAADDYLAREMAILTGPPPGGT